MRTDAYWEGYEAAKAGKERSCLNPWSAMWSRDWLHGYDDAVEENHDR